MDYKRTETKEEERFVVFELKDDSMSPCFKIGDEIEVDTRADVKNGDIVVAIIEDGRIIMRQMHKRNDEYMFFPSDSRYDIIFSENPLIIGRAVRYYRKL